MRYAILGDIHGNIEALSAVLRDAARHDVTQFVCLGDIVGYNPDPGPCIRALQRLPCTAVRGNHDHFCSGTFLDDELSEVASEALAWTRRQLDDEQTAYVGGLPRSTTIADFALVHNTLNEREEWDYVFDITDAERHFGRQVTPLCFHGHTHVPIVFEKKGRIRLRRFSRLQIETGTRYFINVGSVGQPRDRDPRAAYAIYDPGERVVQLRRVEYDIAATQRKITQAGLPEWLALRLDVGM